MKTQRFYPIRNAGFALLDVLVSFGIMSIAVAIFFQYSHQILLSKNEAEIIRQRMLIKSTLLTATSCPSIAACKGSELRKLEDREGRVLVNDLGTTLYGVWQVRAQCQPDRSIEIRVSSFADGRFRLDPLNRKPLDWNNDRGLLIEAGSLCGSIDGMKNAGRVTVLTGKYCLASEGSCEPPAETKGKPLSPPHYCCENGSDRPKPQCNAPAKEIESYWDRAGDWGADGSWVVICK